MTLHIVADDDIDRTKKLEEFWINKMKETMQVYIITDEDRRVLIANLRECNRSFVR